MATLMSYQFSTKINEYSYKNEGMSDNHTYENWYYDYECKIQHRIDGPAFIMIELELPGNKISAYQEWWFMGIKYDCSSQEEFERLLKLKAFL